MNNGTKDLIKIIILDMVLAIVLVVCYSPGLLNLRPSDDNILRAGFSILTIPVTLLLFYVINIDLLKQKSVKTYDGKRVIVKATDGNILDDIDDLNDQIKDSTLLGKSDMCRSCIADIFIKANDEDNDFTIPTVRRKLEYYLGVYIDTLKRIIILEKYSNTSLYKNSYREISSTLDLLQEVFLKALDQMLSNTLNGAELDKIVLGNMMALDGYGSNPFEDLKNKYN